MQAAVANKQLLYFRSQTVEIIFIITSCNKTAKLMLKEPRLSSIRPQKVDFEMK